MTYPTSRRRFLQTLGAALSAGLLPNLGRPAAKTTPWLVGCRDIYLKLAGQSDCWSAMKALGAESTEVSVGLDLSCPNLFHPSKTYTLANRKGIQILKDELAANHCAIGAFLMSNHFDKRLEAELNATRAIAAAAAQLGVKAIRIDLRPEITPPDRFLSFAVKTCKRLSEMIASCPVRIGVENHSTTTNNPHFLEQLFERADSPKIGLTLDVANFYWWGLPLDKLYPVYEKFAARVVHTHCKSIHYPVEVRNTPRKMGWGYDKYSAPIYEGDIDYQRLIAILRKAGYQGDLCVEDESLHKAAPDQRPKIIRAEIAMLKELARS